MAIGRRQFPRPSGQEAIVLFLQLALVPQRLFPPPFQLAGHQAVLGLDAVVLSSRMVGRDPGSLQALLPVLIQPLPLALEIGHGLDTQLQRSRLKGPQDFRGDQHLQRLARQALAHRLATLNRSTIAQIIDRLPLGVVGDPHPPPAPPARHQPAQQRRAAANHARCRGQAAVGSQPLLIGQVAVPSDVGGDLRRDHHLPLQPWHLDGAGAGSARLLPPQILAGEPEGIAAGVVGMVENPVEGGPASRPPLELTRVGSAGHADAQRDVIADQVAEHSPGRTQFVELVEDQMDDMLDLLVRIPLEPIARRRAHVADGGGGELLAAAPLFNRP